MTSPRPLLMIPGPVEVDPEVVEASSGAPASHLDPALITAFGESLAMMRRVWLAADDAQPFIVAGSGTLAMEMAAANLIDPGDPVLVVDTGYFSQRMAEILRRFGAEVRVLSPPGGPGASPSAEHVAESLDRDPARALFVTHVDTSTGVRTDAAAFARVAREREVLSVFDGVCATAAEAFHMADWGADVYLTASQKAIGLPAGLALLVASPRAIDARTVRKTLPPLYLDFFQWRPIMDAYAKGAPAYFATPPTTLIPALHTSLRALLDRGMPQVFDDHRRAADAMRAGLKALRLRLLPHAHDLCANTLSAVYYPDGLGAELLPRVKAHGVVLAGGLHPELRTRYFRVGHMGYATTQPDMLRATLRAIASAMRDLNAPHADPEQAVEAFDAAMS